MKYKALKITALVLVLLPVIALLYLIFLFDWNAIKGFAESKANETTGRTIKLDGDIDVDFGWNIFSPKVSLNNVTVSNMETGTAPEMVKAEKIEFRFKLLSAFGRLNFPLIRVENAEVLLEKDKQGQANWLFGEKDEDDEESEPPKIGLLYVKNSKLTYKDPTEKTDVTLIANSDKDFRDESRKIETFITMKGEGRYKNNPVTINYTGASVLELQDKTQPYPLRTSLNIGKTRINIEGTVLNPNEMEGLNITLNVSGANAADLFPIFGIALPPTPPYSLTGSLDYKNNVWRFIDFKGRMGSSDLNGNLSWDTNKERPLFTARFTSNQLNFKDLGGFIGAPPPEDVPDSKLTAEQKAKQAKQEVSPYIIPDAPLDISRLKAMDADVEFTGKQVISTDLPLDDFFMKVILDDSLLKVAPVKFGTANGDILANLEVNARQQPVKIASEFQFRKLQLSRLFEKMPIGNKNYNKGYIGGTAKLKGTGKSLREMLANSNGDIGIGMEGGQLSNLLIELIGLDVAESLGFFLAGDKPVPVRCVIGDFEVKNGVMESRAIYADTNDTNIKGKGKITLKDEKMDIELRARPKDESILSLKSPIFIRGTLKNPEISIGADELLVRGGVAAAASVALTPFVGALAFIEPGLGKDSDCAKLISQMNLENNKTRGESLVPRNKNYQPAKVDKAKEKAKVAPVSTPELPGKSLPR